MEEIDLLKPGCVHLSLLDPFNEKELLEKLAARGVSAISMEFVPRTTRAQKMDVLSSQANLAGYEAVILAARYSNKIFPMMTTAAGRSSRPGSSSSVWASPVSRPSPPPSASARR